MQSLASAQIAALSGMAARLFPVMPSRRGRALRSIEDVLLNPVEDHALYAVLLLDRAVDAVPALAAHWQERFPADLPCSLAGEPVETLRTVSVDLAFESITPLHGRALLTDSLLHADGSRPGNTAVPPHSGAIVITAACNPDPGSRRPGSDKVAMLSRAVCLAMTELPSATHVLWPSALRLLPRRTVFARYAQLTAAAVPPDAWVSCRAFRDEAGRTVGYTRGLPAFGASEFEAVDAPEAPVALLARLRALVAREYGSGNGSGLTPPAYCERLSLTGAPEVVRLLVYPGQAGVLAGWSTSPR